MNAFVAPDQRARALRAADLVRAERHKIGAERLDIECDAARRLHGIDMQQTAVAMHDLGRLATGWITPVSLLAAISETSARSRKGFQPPLQCRKIDDAVRINRNLPRCAARKPPARQHRRMLDRRDQQPVERPLVGTAWIEGESASAFASVPPEVKMTLRGSAPTSAATSPRACSISRRAARPSPCTEDGLPVSSSAAVMAARAAGRSGAVAFQSR